MSNPRRYLPNGLEAAWLLLGLATLSIEARDAAGALSGTIDSIILLRFGLDCIALTIVVGHLARVPRLRLSPILVFLGYVAFGVASSLWSASFVASLGKSVELLAAVLVVWITMAKPDADLRLQRLINWTVIELMLCLAYVTLGAILVPVDFIEPSRGLFAHSLTAPLVSTDGISRFGALLGLFFLARALSGHRRWRLYLFLYVVCLAFPVLSQGRTGMVMVVFGSALLFARRYPVGSILALPAAALIGILLGSTLLKLFLRGQNTQLLYSLSGRTGFWEAGWDGFLKHPLIGAGFGVGSRTVFLTLDPNREISTIHNGFLEVLLGVGLIGFILWAAAMLWAARLAVGAYLRKDDLPPLIGIVSILVATAVSVEAGGWLSFEMQFFLAATAFLWLRARRRVASPRPGTRLVLDTALARPLNR